jgi:hypothetical protein
MRRAATSRPTETKAKSAPSFEQSRLALSRTLESLSFVKVVSVQHGEKTPYGGCSYTGEAIELHFRDTREKPKLVFFDKFGRARGQFMVGPIHLVQAPLGQEAISSLPTVGDILIGSLVPNTRKSHLEFVLRGWSSDAKPLHELLRILKFGTRMHELEMKTSLVQSNCMLLQCPPNLKKSRDDIYMTAKVVLWGNLRPLQILAVIENPDKYSLLEDASKEEYDAAKAIKITLSCLDFIDGLIVKFPDEKLSEQFLLGLKEIAPVAVSPITFGRKDYGQFIFDPTFSKDYLARIPGASDASNAPKSPAYAPTSPTGPSNVPKSPAYAPKSPVYAPTSPAYVPSPYPKPASPYAPKSPYLNKTPQFGVPGSPTYTSY